MFIPPRHSSLSQKFAYSFQNRPPPLSYPGLSNEPLLDYFLSYFVHSEQGSEPEYWRTHQITFSEMTHTKKVYKLLQKNK